jgi:Helix-turn-helix domain
MLKSWPMIGSLNSRLTGDHPILDPLHRTRSDAEGPRRTAPSVGPGVAILRVLLFRFSSTNTGVCIPSLRTIAKATGYSKQAIVTSLRKLEALGVVTIVRRLVKAKDAVGNL